MVANLPVQERAALKKELEQVFEPRASDVLLNVFERLWRNGRSDSLTREDFHDLKQNMAKLAAAQTRTDESVQALAAAQTRTDKSVKALAAVQARTDESVKALAAAQTQTDEAVKALATAQARTDESVKALAARTDKAIEALTEAVAQTNKSVESLARQVGGLSDAVGGDIEDIAYIVLHDVLQREYGWQVGALERSWQKWGSEPEEIDLFRQAEDAARPERKIWIVGEAKHNLTLKQAEHFIKKIERAKRHLSGEVFAVCFCYRLRPEVKARVKQAGLHLVFSYGKLE